MNKIEQTGEAEAAFVIEELITFIDQTLSKTSPEQHRSFSEFPEGKNCATIGSKLFLSLLKSYCERYCI